MRLRDTPEFKDLDPEELCERIEELTRKKDFWKHQYDILEAAASKWAEEIEQMNAQLTDQHATLSIQNKRMVEMDEENKRLNERVKEARTLVLFTLRHMQDSEPEACSSCVANLKDALKLLEDTDQERG